MDCKQCGKEIQSKGTKPKQYCSDACRMRYKRTEEPNRMETNKTNEQPDLTASEILARREGYKGRWPPDPLAVPGNPDYYGVCYQDGHGAWQVSKDKPDVKTMTADELLRRLHYITDWKRSPEHLEIMHRLHTLTVAELEAAGQPVPAWKVQEEATA